MKTKIYILSLLGGLLLTMVACLNDGKDDYLDDYESFLCILNSNEQDITFYNTGESAAYNITIDKGGNDLNMLASATLKVLNITIMRIRLISSHSLLIVMNCLPT